MIDLRNITVDFDTVRAVDDVSLRVEKGDVYGIVGFSGAGKSTLVRTINLLQRPNKGDVIIEEQPEVEGDPVIKRNLMELSPPSRVRAGQDQAAFIHDVDIPVDGSLHLIHD